MDEYNFEKRMKEIERDAHIFIISFILCFALAFLMFLRIIYLIIFGA